MKEENLQQNNPNTYALIVESLEGYAIFTTDREGVVTSWNSGAEKILLYKAAEIIGRSADILYTPEDRANEVPAIELGSALRDGQAIDERFHVKKGGVRFWASGKVFPVYMNSEHVGFTKIMQNISDDEQAQINLREEKELAKVITSTFTECMVILKTDLEIVDATSSFIQYFSLDKQRVIGKNLYDVLDGDINLGQFRSFLESAIKTHRFHSDFEVDFEHPQRGARIVLIKPRRIYQPPNLLFSLEFTDLTEDKAIAEEKDIFISIASHEIRTPIAVIKAYGQILDKELKEAKPIVKRAVQKINEQTSFMSSLIAALLDTSKITTGKLILNKEVFNLCTLVKDTIESFSLTTSTHKIILAQEADSVVFADKIRTGTVITNLLSNAVKYSPEANEVMVRLETSDQHVTATVQDFGIGIPESERSTLFTRFGRTESIKKTNISGTGLGLHLAAQIIKLEGGEMGFISNSGQGSTFYFKLPLY